MTTSSPPEDVPRESLRDEPLRDEPLSDEPLRDPPPPITSRNPLRAGLRLGRMPEPCTMVIIGATGDLTERKLAPALYNLMLGGALPPEFSVVGFARRDLSDAEFRDHLRKGSSISAASFTTARRGPGSPSGWNGSIATAARPGIASSTWPSRQPCTPRSCGRSRPRDSPAATAETGAGVEAGRE